MEKEKSQKKENVALSSVLASVVLTLMKLIVGIITGSMGIISEAAHSALDFGAALLTFFAVRIGDKPADEKHHFGHQKVESVSALIETGLLFFTSGWIIYEAVKRLIARENLVEIKWYAFAVIAISIIIDISRSRALKQVAKETGSQALEADALHFSSDILSSFVVLIGLAFAAMGVKMADSIAAIGVSFFVLHAGYQLGKRTIDVLIDAAPEGLQDAIEEICRKASDKIAVQTIRIRPAGASVFINLSITVDRRFSLDVVHKITEKIEDKIHERVPEADIHIHTKPYQMSNETIIERVRVIAANRQANIHNIMVEESSKGKKYINFDLEVNNKTTVREAHKASKHLEESIRKEIDDNLVINSHIEPVSSKEFIEKSLSNSTKSKIEDLVRKISQEFRLVKKIHDLKISQIQNRIYISLHCLFSDEALIEEAHQIASNFEGKLKASNPKIYRVVIHVEPIGEGEVVENI